MRCHQLLPHQGLLKLLVLGLDGRVGGKHLRPSRLDGGLGGGRMRRLPEQGGRLGLHEGVGRLWSRRRFCGGRRRRRLARTFGYGFGIGRRRRSYHSEKVEVLVLL